MSDKAKISKESKTNKSVNLVSRQEEPTEEPELPSNVSHFSEFSKGRTSEANKEQLATQKFDELLTPLERIKARVEVERMERNALREKLGDPVEAFAKLVANVSPEIIQKNFSED